MSDFEEERMAEEARRRAGQVSRRRYLVTVAAVVLGVALSVTLAPRALSGAASVSAAASPGASPGASLGTTPTVAPNDDGVTWNPDGAVVQSKAEDGNCEIEMDATVSAPGNPVIVAIQNAIDDESAAQVNSDGISSLSSWAYPAPAGATSLQMQADAQVDCSLVNQTDAYLKKTGHGSLGLVLDSYLRPGSGQLAAQRAIAALPEWARGAIGAIAGAVTYVAVSVVVVATAVALGAATTASGGLASPVLAVFAGCIGGAASVAVQRYFAGVSNSVKTTLASALAGCLTGGLIAKVPASTTGAWMGQEIRAVLGAGPAEVVGQTVVQDAAAANVGLSPISQALANASAALASP